MSLGLLAFGRSNDYPYLEPPQQTGSSRKTTQTFLFCGAWVLTVGVKISPQTWRFRYSAFLWFSHAGSSVVRAVCFWTSLSSVYLQQILTIQLLRAAIVSGTPDVKEEPMLFLPTGSVSFHKKSKIHCGTFKIHLEGLLPFSLHILWYLLSIWDRPPYPRLTLNLLFTQGWFWIPDFCAATCQVLVAKAGLKFIFKSRLALNIRSFLLPPLSVWKLQVHTTTPA